MDNPVKKPDVLFLNIEFPLPADNGGKLAVLGFLEALCNISNLTVLTLGKGDLTKHVRELQEQLPSIKDIHAVPHKIHIQQDPKALLGVGIKMLARRLPYFAAKFDSAPFQSLLNKTLTEKSYQHVIICHDTRLGGYLPTVRRYAPRAFVEGIVIDIEANVLADFQSKRTGVAKYFAAIEQRRCANFEHRIRNELDHIFCLSMSDMDYIKAEGANRSVSYLPTAFKISVSSGKSNGALPLPEVRVLMVSNLSWQPNAEAARWMLNEVAPRLWELQENAQILLVGKGTIEFAASQQNERIKGLGFVDDINQLYQNVTAVAVPVLSKSGIRVKLLDAMASAVPIVCTATAAKAIGAKHGTHLLASDDPQLFAESIVELASNVTLANTLRTNAAEFILANHSIEKIQREFTEHFATVRRRTTK